MRTAASDPQVTTGYRSLRWTRTPKPATAVPMDGVPAARPRSGGIGYADPSTGVSADLKVRTLVAHAENGHGEWGVSGGFRIAPDERGRGLSVSVEPAYGMEAGDTDVVWSARDAAELVPGAETHPSARLDGEVGYGLPAFSGLFTGTPYAGLSATDAEYMARVGWRLRPADDGPFRLSLEASQREADGDGPAHGVGFRLETRW